MRHDNVAPEFVKELADNVNAGPLGAGTLVDLQSDPNCSLRLPTLRQDNVAPGEGLAGASTLVGPLGAGTLDDLQSDPNCSL